MPARRRKRSELSTSSKDVEPAPLWHRLNRYVVPASTELQRLNWLHKKLEGLVLSPSETKPLTNDEVRHLGHVVRRIATDPKLYDVYSAPGRQGRRANLDRKVMIAIDYFAALKQLGKGRSEDAADEVARQWNIDPETVRSYRRQFSTTARYQLGELLKDFVNELKVSYTDGRQPEYWTHETVLKAIRANVVDWRDWDRRRVNRG